MAALTCAEYSRLSELSGVLGACGGGLPYQPLAPKFIAPPTFSIAPKPPPPNQQYIKQLQKRNYTKKGQTLRFVLYSSGGRTRTYDLRVMSPTSYQLLYSAMYVLPRGVLVPDWTAKVEVIF